MLGLSSLSGPKPPAAAAGAGFNVLTFVDTFPSTASVDMSQSKAAGFNWYLNTAWPNAAGNLSGNWATIQTDHAVDPNNITAVSQFLRHSTGANGSGLGIETAVANGSTWRGTGFNGSVGGAYFEVISAWDPAINPVTIWPIAWTVDLRFLTGAVTRHTELDLFERNGAPLTFAVHDWDFSTNPATDNGNSGNWQSVAVDLTDTKPHKYGTLWQTTTQGGGTGSIQRYIDDVHLPFFDVTWTAGAQYSTLDAATLMLILSAGGGVATQFRVAVWQASAAGVTRQ